MKSSSWIEVYTYNQQYVTLEYDACGNIGLAILNHALCVLTEQPVNYTERIKHFIMATCLTKFGHHQSSNIHSKLDWFNCKYWHNC